ncbi:MAG: AAA family ATPase [Erysipelotrichaceae bacterium]|nr:AAA family ATPase [Erysipelotrichaceae bacterium]
MKTIKRIVFTGGPCSGKTTFTSRAQSVFSDRGYRVIIDHESATDLISGGISPATMGMYDFQKYCIDLQLKKEELCYKAAQEIEGGEGSDLYRPWHPR